VGAEKQASGIFEGAEVGRTGGSQEGRVGERGLFQGGFNKRVEPIGIGRRACSQGSLGVTLLERLIIDNLASLAGPKGGILV